MVQIMAIMSSHIDLRYDDIFEAYLNGDHFTLSARDKVNLDYLLIQLYGSEENLSLMWKGINQEWNPTTEDFKPIKDAMVRFIQENMDGSNLKTIKATIPYFPLSRQTIE